MQDGVVAKLEAVEDSPPEEEVYDSARKWPDILWWDDSMRICLGGLVA